MTADINLRSHIQATYSLGQPQSQSTGGGTQGRKAGGTLAERRADIKSHKYARKGEPTDGLQEPRVYELEDDESEDQLAMGEESNDRPEVGSLKHYRSVTSLQSNSDSKRRGAA